MTLHDKIRELDCLIANISAIQRQLLKELGYEIKWKQSHKSNVRISKIKKEDE